MTPDSKRYFRPETIQKIGRLEIRAKHIVEGFLAGMHRSPYFGQSVEFLQHREYTPGDDLRHVDWQVWARQDRIYVKQFEEDTNMRVNVLVDASKSMAYGRGAFSKFDYAATLAVSIAYLVLKQQDAVGCLTFDEQVRTRLPTLSRRDHLQAIVANLQETSTTSKTDLASILADAAHTYPRRGLMVVLSDFFGPGIETRRGLRLLKQRGNDVLVLQILDDDELDFPFKKPTRFMDMESSAQLHCNPKALRDSYLEAIQDFLHELKRGCASDGVDYALVRTSDPFDAVLTTFLNAEVGRSRR